MDNYEIIEYVSTKDPLFKYYLDLVGEHIDNLCEDSINLFYYDNHMKSYITHLWIKKNDSGVPLTICLGQLGKYSENDLYIHLICNSKKSGLSASPFLKAIIKQVIDDFKQVSQISLRAATPSLVGYYKMFGFRQTSKPCDDTDRYLVSDFDLLADKDYTISEDGFYEFDLSNGYEDNIINVRNKYTPMRKKSPIIVDDLELTRSQTKSLNDCVTIDEYGTMVVKEDCIDKYTTNCNFLLEASQVQKSLNDKRIFKNDLKSKGLIIIPISSSSKSISYLLQRNSELSPFFKIITKSRPILSDKANSKTKKKYKKPIYSPKCWPSDGWFMSLCLKSSSISTTKSSKTKVTPSEELPCNTYKGHDCPKEQCQQYRRGYKYFCRKKNKLFK